MNIHPRDARERRPFFDLSHECRETPSISFHNDLDGVILAVSDVPGKAKSASGILHEVSVPDPLDSSVDHDVFCLQSHDRQTKDLAARDDRGQRIRTLHPIVHPG